MPSKATTSKASNGKTLTIKPYQPGQRFLTKSSGQSTKKSSGGNTYYGGMAGGSVRISVSNSITFNSFSR